MVKLNRTLFAPAATIATCVGGCSVRERSEDGCSTDRDDPLSETRKYRKFSAQQKTEIVLASWRGPKSVAELCREQEISERLLRKWRDQFLAAGAERLQGKSERTEVDELRGQVAELERALGRRTMEVEVAGELLRGRVLVQQAEAALDLA
jgi:transposase